jgi:hypothetical protein
VRSAVLETLIPAVKLLYLKIARLPERKAEERDEG